MWGTEKFKATGRVMVDTSNFNRTNPNYLEFHSSLQFARHPRMQGGGNSDIVSIKDDLLYMTWPVLGGFSFSQKRWGEIQVDNLTDIQFDEAAFKRLVLPPEQKELIHALVVSEKPGNFADIISGKGAGCIFLLHGRPGVGKTLTAEAIAELLQKPLYSISVGELGTKTTVLEVKLKEILEVASSWGAVILIDEADIFLEKRTEKDIERNAMVGVFLRLLEYHQGILFLTTNRVQCFDTAFHSRITVALHYKDLDEGARENVWRNLLEAAGIKGLDTSALAKYNVNGRQIRTMIRLSQSLAVDTGVKVSESHLARTLQIAQQFEKDAKIIKD
jgi:SpoVK/Ycf46/Vps4 family AAA+-type ATPase